MKSIDGRSVKVVKNVTGSFVIKGWACIVQLLIVPLTYGCLGKYEYGIWLTLSSILVWMDSFDLGLGNGLRNKLATFVAKDRWEEARQAVSTTLFILILVVLHLVLACLLLVQFCDIGALLKLEAGSVSLLKETIEVSVAFVGCTLVLKFLGNIYLGLQMPAINNMLVVAGQTLGLAGIWAGDKLLGGLSLFHVAFISTLSPVIVYLVAYPVTFRRYPQLLPSLSAFRKGMVRELFTMGINFFILQVSGMVLFFSSNLLITILLGAEEVTPYQVSYKYFAFLTMLFSIVIAPLWTASTDAYVKGELSWIRGCTRRMRYLLAGFVVLIVIMVAVSPYVYELWVGDVGISFTLSALMGVYTAVLLYSLYYAHILFGIGFIRLQMYVTLAEAVVFVPLAIWGARLLGTEGIICALILVNLACMITNKIQYNKIMSGNTSGIWGK